MGTIFSSLISRLLIPISNSIKDWWEAAIKTVSKDKKCAFNAASIYSMWNLLKERNRRIFQNEGFTSLALANEGKRRTMAACFLEV
jgi:hypothetical protein